MLMSSYYLWINKVKINSAFLAGAQMKLLNKAKETSLYLITEVAAVTFLLRNEGAS